jgi:hypothetical protein
MSDTEKMRKTIERASEAFKRLPEWERAEKRTTSAAVERTVRPISKEAKTRQR